MEDGFIGFGRDHLRRWRPSFCLPRSGKITVLLVLNWNHMFPSRSAPSTGSLQLKAVEAAAQGFGITVQVFEARRAADIAEAFYALDRSRFQGLLLLLSPLIGGNPQLVADLAIRRNLPTISLFPEIARAGGLLGYGPDIQDLFRQGACFASSFSSVALAEEFVEWRRHTEASPVKRLLLPPAS